jgi:hypothetical protein
MVDLIEAVVSVLPGTQRLRGIVGVAYWTLVHRPMLTASVPAL